MADTLQLRGGTTQQHTNFTGADREVTVDTTKKTLVVHHGGSSKPLMREEGNSGSQVSSVKFATSGTDAIAIDSSQRVLQGHANSRKIGNEELMHQLEGISASTGLSITRNNSSATTSPKLIFGKSAGSSIGDFSKVSENHVLGEIRFSGADGDDLTNYAASIVGLVDGDTQTNAVPGRLEFRTTIGSDANTPAMTIDKDGNCGIGTTDFSSILHIADNEPELTIQRLGNHSTTAGPLMQFKGRGSNENMYNLAKIDAVAKSGANNAGHLRFYTNNAGTQNVGMIITSDGNVGIGTTTPTSTNVAYDSAALHLHQVGAGNNGSQIHFTNYYTQAGAGDGVHLSMWSDRNFYITNQEAVDTNGSGGQFRFSTSAVSNCLVIGADGRVGIGTTISDTLLHLKGTGDEDASDSAPVIRIENSDASLVADQLIGGLEFEKLDPNGAGAGVVGGLRMYSQGMSGENTYLTLSTSSSASNDNEAFRINGDGHILLGTSTTIDAGKANKGTLMVSGTATGASQSLIQLKHNDNTDATNRQYILIYNNNSDATINNGQIQIVGSITANSTRTFFNETSDYRLKENITAISDGITRLKTLKPYRFNFKADASTTVDGFLAHEVTAVPEAITGTKDAVDADNKPIYQMIDTSKLIPLLVAAVKELIGKVEALEAA